MATWNTKYSFCLIWIESETAADSQFNGTEIATHDSAAAANLTAHILEILKQSNKAVEEQHGKFFPLKLVMRIRNAHNKPAKIFLHVVVCNDARKESCCGAFIMIK